MMAGQFVGPYRLAARHGTTSSNPISSSAESATNLVAAGASHAGGTQSSNPLCSSGESATNLIPRSP